MHGRTLLISVITVLAVVIAAFATLATCHYFLLRKPSLQGKCGGGGAGAIGHAFRAGAIHHGRRGGIRRRARGGGSAAAAGATAGMKRVSFQVELNARAWRQWDGRGNARV